jgi:hypothetical protein
MLAVSGIASHVGPRQLGLENTKGRPPSPSKSNPLIAARFINENIVIRMEVRCIVKV